MEQYNKIQTNINKICQEIRQLNNKIIQLTKDRETQINNLDSFLKSQKCSVCNESAQVYNCFDINFMCKQCYWDFEKNN